MSRQFTDNDLLIWESYPTGGVYGLPERPRIIFNCLSDPTNRPRYVNFAGDEADAEGVIERAPVGQLQEMLRESHELE